MRKILITNDDGIFADGIIRLARAAKKYGDERSYAFINSVLSKIASKHGNGSR